MHGQLFASFILSYNRCIKFNKRDFLLTTTLINHNLKSQTFEMKDITIR